MKDKTTYQQPKPVPVPDFAGYPDKTANTQTNKMKGLGAATKGTGFQKNCLMTQFARGKLAFGFCDICGFRHNLDELKSLTERSKVVNIRLVPSVGIQTNHKQFG